MLFDLIVYLTFVSFLVFSLNCNELYDEARIVIQLNVFCVLIPLCVYALYLFF